MTSNKTPAWFYKNANPSAKTLPNLGDAQKESNEHLQHLLSVQSQLRNLNGYSVDTSYDDVIHSNVDHVTLETWLPPIDRSDWRQNGGTYSRNVSMHTNNNNSSTGQQQKRRKTVTSNRIDMKILPESLLSSYDHRHQGPHCRKTHFTSDLSQNRDSRLRETAGPIQRPHTARKNNQFERQKTRFGAQTLQDNSKTTTTAHVTQQSERTYTLHSELKTMLGP